MSRLRFLFLAIALVLIVACRRDVSGGTVAAPPPEVTDATAGLRFTWLDEKGNFHSGDKVADVPVGARDVVRVADPSKEDPPDKIYLADLRNAGADGKYAVRVADRDELDKVAVARRAKFGSVLADTPAGSGSTTAQAHGPDVIIYGASWCGPCHQAASYLKQKGVDFVLKDIDEDRSAAREMQAKLSRAGMASGSIPVIDVRGRLLVGFDPGAVDRALSRQL
ncbi:MAG TPA: glutaredoxin family protein [Labilithrix sp.]